MAVYLRQPDFFSPALQRYLTEICDQVGRHLVFVGVRQAMILGSAAQIWTEPNLPVAEMSIIVDDINPRKYDPPWHDPLIAREATHLQLWFEGRGMIKFDEHIDLRSRRKAEAVTDWLTDPIINKRLSQRGLSMGPDRIHEIEEAIRVLQNREWSMLRMLGRMDDVHQIRFYVSFCLEPDIPTELKHKFQEAFKRDLPDIAGVAREFLSLIETGGFDTPEKYRTTAIRCWQKWEVDVQRIKFHKFQRCTAEEQQKWIAENITEGKDWE